MCYPPSAATGPSVLLAVGQMWPLAVLAQTLPALTWHPSVIGWPQLSDLKPGCAPSGRGLVAGALVSWAPADDLVISFTASLNPRGQPLLVPGGSQGSSHDFLQRRGRMQS